MSDLAFALWMMALGFWAGHGYHLWWRRKLDRHQPNETHVAFAKAIVASAQKLQHDRRFVGEGVRIERHQVWTMSGVGRFRVTLEEVAEDVIT